MTTTLRKTFALLLCLCMCLSLVPAAYAEEGAFGEEEAFSFEEPAFGEEPVEEEPAFSEEPFSEEPFAEEPAFSEEPAEELPAEEESIEEEPAEQEPAEEPAEEPESEAEPAEQPAFEAEEGEDFDASASGTWGSLSWSLDADGKLTITGRGKMNDFGSNAPNAWLAYKTDIKSVVIDSGVTSIGSHAFEYCSSLTSVTIPNSVTAIGKWAFYNCGSLTSVTIPDSVTAIDQGAFSNCSSLTSVTIGNRVTTISDCAFEYCSSLTSVTIPDSVTEIGEYAFSGCSSLTSVNIGSGVTSIGDDAFRECINLTSVNIPDSVTEIGEGAFRLCSSLTSVTIGNSVTYIGHRAFFCCSNLTSVNIGNSVTEIGDQAFDGCTSLTSVTIPNSVTRIGYSAFFDCTSLTSVTIGNGTAFIGGSAFYNCTSLTSVTIPNSVTFIGGGAFYNCSSLTSVTIGNSVTLIQGGVFAGCFSLTDVYYTGTQAQWDAIDIEEGNEPLMSATLHVTPQILPTPTLVSAAASGSNIVFGWNAVDGAAGYRVYRKYAGVNWTVLCDVTGTSYTDTDVTKGTVYTYTARCLNAAWLTISGFDATGKSAFVALPTPTLVSAAASGNSIVFKWNAVNSSPKYRVYRKYAGVNWTAVANVSGTSYTDTNVTKGTVYTYTVRCLSADGKTCVSSFNTTGKSAFVALPTPTLVSAAASGNSIVFKWNAVNGSPKYRVYRKYAGVNWTAVANVSGTSYTDTNVTKGTVYTYTVRCLSADGKTCVSSFNTTGKSAFVALPAPTLVSAAASGNSIVFKWSAVNGSPKYRVYRKTGSGSWTALANVTGTSYTDTNVTKGTVYTYTVRCLSADGKTCVSGFNATGKSAYVSLPTPTLVSASASGSSIVFKWNSVSGASKYRVYRKTGSGSWTALANVTGTSYTDTNVTKGVLYTYTVRCLSADGKTCVSGFNATGKSARVG